MALLALLGREREEEAAPTVANDADPVSDPVANADNSAPLDNDARAEAEDVRTLDAP